MPVCGGGCSKGCAFSALSEHISAGNHSLLSIVSSQLLTWQPFALALGPLVMYEHGVLLNRQDCFLDSQTFSQEMNREVLQQHTALWAYPNHALD